MFSKELVKHELAHAYGFAWRGNCSRIKIYRDNRGGLATLPLDPIAQFDDHLGLIGGLFANEGVSNLEDWAEHRKYSLHPLHKLKANFADLAIAIQDMPPVLIEVTHELINKHSSVLVLIDQEHNTMNVFALDLLDSKDLAAMGVDDRHKETLQ